MSEVKGIESVLAQANKILNQTLNIHIENHLVESIIVKKIFIFIYNTKT